ncbi:MAG: enolase C-terminal domain-like protein [Terriglobia bacterium]
MDRRQALRWFSTSALAGSAHLLPFEGSVQSLWAQSKSEPLQGLGVVKIRDLETILTYPNGIRMVIVKVLTTEPGLHGYGCATFTQRPLAVQTAVEKYLKPFLLGRNVDEIEDIWQSTYVSSYWRNGPVLFNAMSGVDMALWDIKGKRANMPVYQLLGGKCRFAAECYYHASGRDFQELENNARQAMEQGFRHIRIQADVPGFRTYGIGGTDLDDKDIGPTNPKSVWESTPYLLMVPKMFETMRAKLGDQVELIHDIHERLTPSEAVNLCKEVEKYRPFFIEDPVPPEETDHFRLIRQQCSTPIAMGELFNNVHEFLPLISNRYIDFIRIHISQIGGLSMARKVAALCEFFGVRTAWHGPGDASPVAHAAQLALELASYNFGIHEGHIFPPETREIFKGCPEIKNGYLYAHEVPGLGVEVDEALAAKYPFPANRSFDPIWGTIRKRDGTVIRP